MPSFEKEMLTYCKTGFDEWTEKELVADLVVPDSEADVLDVILCDAMVITNSLQQAGGRLIVKGRVDTFLLCRGEAENSNVFLEKSLDFEQSFDCPDFFENAVLSSEVSTANVSCKILNSRKVGIRVLLQIRVMERENANQEVITGGERIQKKCEAVRFSQILGSETKVLRIGEDLDISGEIPNGATYLYAKAFAACTEKKTINNRLVVKGNIRIHSFWLITDGKVMSTQNDIPFNHVFTVNDLDESSCCTVDFNVKFFQAEVLKTKESSAKALAADVELTAVCTAYTLTEKSIVTDMFSTKNLCRAKVEKILVETVPCAGKGAGEFTERITFPSTLIGLSSIHAEPVITRVICDNASAKAKGYLVVSAVGNTEGYSTKLYEKQVPFEADTDAECGSNCRALQLNVGVQNLNYHSVSANEIEIAGSVVIEMVYCSANEISVITDVECSGERETGNGFCVYYPLGTESFWEIAKRYGVSLKSLLDVNDCNGEICNESMVLIPKCE